MANADKKLCRKCDTVKPITDFYKGNQSQCKACDKAYHEARRKTVKYKQAQRIAQAKWLAKGGKLKNHKARIKREYGISLEQVEKLRKKQNNKCAICGVPEVEEGKPLQIDHCHTTKVIRGLLCHKCNKGIGCLKDDVEVARKAFEYLKQYQTKAILT